MTDERINQVLECGFRYAKYKLCLRKNRIKDDPNTADFKDLVNGLLGEVRELTIAIDRALLLEYSDVSLNEIALEAADVINYAAMLCDLTEHVGQKIK